MTHTELAQYVVVTIKLATALQCLVDINVNELFRSTLWQVWYIFYHSIIYFVPTYLGYHFIQIRTLLSFKKKRCTIIMFTMQKPFYFQSSKHQMCFRLNCSFPCGSSTGRWLLLSNIIETHRCILCMPRFYRTNPSDAIATLEFRRRQNKNKIFQV